MRKSPHGDFLIINIALLRQFKRPTSAYDLFKEGSWSSYTGAFKQVHRLLKLGLITQVFTVPSAKGGVKKLHVLTKIGEILLTLFPESGGVDKGLLEAVPSYEVTN